MTKSISLLTFLVFTMNYLIAQSDYMDRITEKSCQCVEELSDTLSSNALTMQFGLCIINAAKPYRAEIKRDYGIDTDDIFINGERLGQIIGMEMATGCPDLLIQITTQMLDDENSYVSERLYGSDDFDIGEYADYDFYSSVYGKITAIDIELFYVFSVRDQSGKSIKLYWLDPFLSDVNIQENPKSFVGQSFDFEYEELEFFDPKLQEYRNFRVIRSMTNQ